MASSSKSNNGLRTNLNAKRVEHTRNSCLICLGKKNLGVGISIPAPDCREFLDNSLRIQMPPHIEEYGEFYFCGECSDAIQVAQQESKAFLEHKNKLLDIGHGLAAKIIKSVKEERFSEANVSSGNAFDAIRCRTFTDWNKKCGTVLAMTPLNGTNANNPVVTNTSTLPAKPTTVTTKRNLRSNFATPSSSGSHVEIQIQNGLIRSTAQDEEEASTSSSSTSNQNGLRMPPSFQNQDGESNSSTPDIAATKIDRETATFAAQALVLRKPNGSSKSELPPKSRGNSPQANSDAAKLGSPKQARPNANLIHPVTEGMAVVDKPPLRTPKSRAHMSEIPPVLRARKITPKPAMESRQSPLSPPISKPLPAEKPPTLTRNPSLEREPTIVASTTIETPDVPAFFTDPVKSKYRISKIRDTQSVLVTETQNGNRIDMTNIETEINEEDGTITLFYKYDRAIKKSFKNMKKPNTTKSCLDNPSSPSPPRLERMDIGTSEAPHINLGRKENHSIVANRSNSRGPKRSTPPEAKKGRQCRSEIPQRVTTSPEVRISERSGRVIKRPHEYGGESWISGDKGIDKVYADLKAEHKRNNAKTPGVTDDARRTRSSSRGSGVGSEIIPSKGSISNIESVGETSESTEGKPNKRGRRPSSKQPKNDQIGGEFELTTEISPKRPRSSSRQDTPKKKSMTDEPLSLGDIRDSDSEDIENSIRVREISSLMENRSNDEDLIMDISENNEDLQGDDTQSTQRAGKSDDQLCNEYHKCPHCYMAFQTKTLYIQHQIKYHSTKQAHRCERCLRLFAEMAHLRDHQRNQIASEQLSCRICQEKHNWHCALDLHTKGHSENFLLNCHICPDIFRSLNDWRSHQLCGHVELVNPQQHRPS